jgi:putative membrane protein
VTSDASDRDVTRRTHLAAERTWLAWWRTGIAVCTAAIAVGGLIPELVDGSRTPYVLLGAGYAVLAIAVFAAGLRRHVRVEEELARGGYARLRPAWVAGLTLAGGLLALGTFLVVVLSS